MAGTGKQKYIAGLRDLVGGFTLMEQRRHMRMLENLEKAKFEYEKQRDELLDMAAAQEARQARVLGVREKQFDRMIDLKKLEDAAQARKQDRVLGARDKAFQRSIDIGNLRAREGALGLSREREARLSLPDVPSSSGSATTGPLSDLDKARQIRSNVSTIAGEIAAEKPKTISLEGILKQNRFLPTSEADYAGPSPKRFEPEATKYVPGAGDLPMPKTAEIDPYEAMSEEEWDNVAWAAIQDAVGRDPAAEKEAMESPHLQTITFAAPSQRRRMLMDIPRLFGRPVQ